MFQSLTPQKTAELPNKKPKENNDNNHTTEIIPTNNTQAGEKGFLLVTI